MGRSFFVHRRPMPEHIVRGMSEIKIAAKDPNTAKRLKQVAGRRRHGSEQRLARRAKYPHHPENIPAFFG